MHELQREKAYVRSGRVARVVLRADLFEIRVGLDVHHVPFFVARLVHRGVVRILVHGPVSGGVV